MVLYYQTPTKQPQKKNKRSAIIQDVDYQGLGIAKIEGKTWFIENGLPDEKIDFLVKEEKRQYGIGKAVKWHSYSPIRRQPECRWYSECGGCQMQHMTIAAQRDTKQTALFRQLQQISPDVTLQPMIIGDEWQYRRRTRLSLQYSAKTGTVLFGFRQQQSNQLVEIDSCAVLVPQLSQLLSPLRQLFQQWQQPQKLGHIELVAADNGVAMLLRHLGELTPQDSDNLNAFAEQYRLILVIITTESKVGSQATQSPYYQLNGIKFYFDVWDFIQVNAAINQKMVEVALEWLALTPMDRVLDLFCGMGNFSLPLAMRVGEVVGVEGVAEMVAKAEFNARQNGIENVAFYQTDLAMPFTDKEWAKEKFNKVLLDPPRAGALFALKHILELQPEKVLYVSCNPATFVRDAKILVENGYRLVKSTMIDMFPQTGHLESINLFIK